MIAVLFTTVVNAQNSKVVTASNAEFNKEYEKARVAIDEAILNEKTAVQAKTWYLRGKIYNAIALDTTGQFSNVTDPIGTALQSFKTAMEMSDVKNYKTDIGGELFTTYNLYFSRGATAYSAGNSEVAYVNFAKAHEANLLQIDAFPLAVLDTGVIFNMGLMAERTGRTTEAVAAYQKLVEMKYSETYLYSKLSNIYLEAGRTEEALAILEEGRKNFPQDKEIQTAELNYYISQKRPDILVDKLNAAIVLDPNNSELYFVLGTTHNELALIYKDSLKALKEMSPNASLASDSIKKIVSKVEKLYDNSYNACIDSHVKAISIDPSKFDYYLNLAAIYYNNAIEINKLMNGLPLEQEALYQKYLKERNMLYLQALPYFENAHKINPSSIESMQALKEIYTRTGDTIKSAEMKQKLENPGPGGIKIGMSFAEVTKIIGASPNDKTKTTTAFGTSEMWFYSNYSLDFENGLLYMIIEQ